MMKSSLSKRILTGLLAFGVTATILPLPVVAAEQVTTTPGNSQLAVEYFNSTLYKWDEDEANRVTMEADATNDVAYDEVSPTFGQVATKEQEDHTPTEYWYAIDGTYYQVYYTRKDPFFPWNSPTYTLYYWNGVTYNQFAQSTNGNSPVDGLYMRSSGGQEGKGFYFTGADNKPEASSIPSFSKWANSKQNYYIYSGLAASKLSESTNAPFDDDTVNAANLFSEENNSYTDVYDNVRVPFVYDDETGYYELNSDQNAVYFENGEAQSDTTMTIADKPVSFYAGTPKNPMCGFQPFEKVSSQTQLAYMGTSANTNDQIVSYRLQDDVNNPGADNTMKGKFPTYGFGMVTSVNFQMTDDGLDANGNPIEFEFSGDDDVWVYVDGVLALDIGGTHDAITGKIDFSTGNVTLTADKYGEIGDMASDSDMSSPSEMLEQENLYTALGTTLTGFASDGTHTLTIYYMDRGRGATNCMIRFNLPQRDTISVTKQISESKDNNGNTSPLTEKEQESINNVNFGFTLYDGNEVVANKTFYVYENNELISSPSTDQHGHFTLQNGQTARFNVEISEEGNSYRIIEDNLLDSGYTEPEFEYTSNIANATVSEKADGFKSMVVQASGSNTTADSISFVCENFLDENLPNPGAALSDDEIVIDYGLPAKIENVMLNDVWRGESAKVISVEEIDGEQYGNAVLNEDGSITYTLTKPLDRVVTLKYTVQVTGTGNTGEEEITKTIEKSANIHIIPATSMYYEENFSDMINYSTGQVKWRDERDEQSYGQFQETGIVGDPNDSTYGSDAVYLHNLGDSYGTSKSADTSGDYAAGFSYEFTGTGTAIYSRISTDSAYIRVTVSKDQKVVDRQYIDTRIIGDVATNKTLFNVPVYNNSGLDYGTYQVDVTIYKEGTPVNGITDEDGQIIPDSDQSGAKFYLDGIRVYQPLIEDDQAERAYAADGESHIALMNIRSKIAADSEVGLGGDNFVTLTDAEGNLQQDDYMSIGPNEELYLNEGDYTASFHLLNWDSEHYNLYLGMKTPDQQTHTVKVGNQTITLNNSADCYYDVSDYITVEQIDVDEDGKMDFSVGTLTVSNADGLVSLTNVKVTGIDEFDIGYSEDIEADGIDENTLYLLPTSYSFANDGNQDDAEVFSPERFDIHVNYARLTKKATVNVATSTDVAYITIDGEKVDPGKAGNSYSFAKTFTKVQKGRTFEIVAYDKNGATSQIYLAIAE